MRLIRNVSQRELAIALLIELADAGGDGISLLGCFEYHNHTIGEIATRIDVISDDALFRKLRVVARRLVTFGVLSSNMVYSPDVYASAIAGASKTMFYALYPGKRFLLTSDATCGRFGPEGEAGYLLRNAYPPTTQGNEHE